MTSYSSRPLREVPRGLGNLSGDPREAPTGDLTIGIGRSMGTVVVKLVGSLDTLAATRLAATLSDLINGQGNLAVAVDVRGLHHVAPSGAQVLSAAASDLERRGGRLSLCADRDAARRPVGHLQNRRSRADHPAGGGRQPNARGGGK